MSGILGSSIARGAFNIVTNGLPQPLEVHGIYVGGAGNVVATGKDGVTVTFNNVPAGATIPIHATHVLPASTATLMVGYRVFTSV